MTNSKNNKTNRVLISASIAALGIIPVFAFSANLSHTVYADTNSALTTAQLQEQKANNDSNNAEQTKAEQIVDQTQAKQETTAQDKENTVSTTSAAKTDEDTVANSQAKSNSDVKAEPQEGSAQTIAKTDDKTKPAASKLAVKAAQPAAKDQVVIGKSTGDTNKDLANTTANNLKNNNYNFDQIVVGTAEDDEINKALGNQSAQALKDNGFVIKNQTVSGKNNLYVQGKDDTGLFYALNEVNTLANRKAKATEFNERQEPQMSIRGVIEGFYGQPWSDQARKDLFKFMGEHRMNVYIYSPKDDDYLRKNWRELYPADKLNELKGLVNAANANHVTFVYTLSPGNDITYSSDDDYNTTVKKFNQLRSIGVKQFYIALDDIPLYLNDTDYYKFPNHDTTGYPNNPWSGLADAQAYYLNRVEKDYIKANKLPDLWLVPTNYSGSAPDPFKEAQGEVLDPDIHMQWTGEGVFSGSITSNSINRAKTTYNTKHLFIWDNFPVNDSDQMRLYLNPVVGRGLDLWQATDGFTANPMIQPYASWFALGSYADYMWTSWSYDPKTSIEKVIQDIAGNDPEKAKALGEFVDLNQYWNHADKRDQVRAPQLTNLFNNYQKANYGTNAYKTAYQALKDRLQDISDLPTSLYGLKVEGFYNDAQPWIQAASHWARAALAALDMANNAKSGKPDLTLIKQDMDKIQSETNAANYKSLPNSRTSQPNQITPEVGDGEFQAEISAAYKAFDQYLALQPIPPYGQKIGGVAPSTNLPTYDVTKYFLKAATDGNLDTKFWSGRNTKKGDWIDLQLIWPTNIQRLVIHQGPADDVTSGDIFYDANIYAGVKRDGSDRKLIGKVTPTGLYVLDLSTPVRAQYISIISNTDTNGWLQIREIDLYSGNGSTGMSRENITDAGSNSMEAASDGSTETIYQGKLQDPSKPGVITQTLVEPATNIHSVAIVGNAKGTVAVYDGKEWHDVGKVDGKNWITRLPISNIKEIDGLRFTLDPKQSQFSLSEIDLSTRNLNPSQPTSPTNPTNPTTPTNPTSPVNPSNPTSPSNPTNPTTPSNPTAPVNPTTPVNPTSPVGPIGPVSPVNPGTTTGNQSSSATNSSGTNTNTSSTGTTITAPHAGSAATSKEVNYIYVLIKRNAGIYNKDGKKHTRKLIHRGSQLRVYRKVKKAKGKRFYVIYSGKYKNKMILTSKVKGIIRTLKRNAYVYKANGKLAKHIGKNLLKKKGNKLVTYGKIRTIHGKRMYQIGRNQFVKVANF